MIIEHPFIKLLFQVKQIKTLESEISELERKMEMFGVCTVSNARHQSYGEHNIINYCSN